MRVRYDNGGKNPDKKDVKIKGVSTKGLTDRQIETLKKHSKHHTAKHMKAMIDDMLNGATFSQSHKKAQKKVGAEKGMVYNANNGMRLKKSRIVSIKVPRKDILGRDKIKAKTEDGTKIKVVRDKDGNIIKRTVVDRDKFGIKRRTTTKTKPGKKKKTVVRGGYARPFDSSMDFKNENMGVGEGMADAAVQSAVSGLAKFQRDLNIRKSKGVAKKK